MYADGWFGEHDPTRTPQFYDESLCHYAVIPRRPTPSDGKHPYFEFSCIWWDLDDKVDIVWSQGSIQGIGRLSEDRLSDLRRAYTHISKRCSSKFASEKATSTVDAENSQIKRNPYLNLLRLLCTCMENMLLRLGHVSTDALTIQVMVATAQRFWLETVAALDYMDLYKPIMDGQAQRDSRLRGERLVGAFTTNVDVVQMFCSAGIPVYFVRPNDVFDNQIVLKVGPLLRPPSQNTTLPTPPYPIIFMGRPSDPRKFTAIHKFLQKFQAHRDPYSFATMKTLTQQPSNYGPIRSQPSQAPRRQAHSNPRPKKKRDGE